MTLAPGSLSPSWWPGSYPLADCIGACTLQCYSLCPGLSDQSSPKCSSILFAPFTIIQNWTDNYNLKSYTYRLHCTPPCRHTWQSPCSHRGRHSCSQHCSPPADSWCPLWPAAGPPWQSLPAWPSWRSQSLSPPGGCTGCPPRGGSTAPPWEHTPHSRCWSCMSSYRKHYQLQFLPAPLSLWW